MDSWSAPNHQAFVAFSVHFERMGVPLAMPLDVVEVAEVSEGRILYEAARALT